MSVFLLCLSLLSFLPSSSMTKGAYKHYISPFPSSSSLNIPNAHLVLDDPKSGRKFYRGMAPVQDGNIESLKQNGIDKILIIKADSHGEVSREILELKAAGFKSEQITQIPIDWKSTDLLKTCKQFIKGLNYLGSQEKASSTYFHCTVGEDRTGVLSGLFSIWQKPKPISKQKIKSIHQRELCDKGYGMGNPNKPRESVVKKIQHNLTPLWVHLSRKISQQAISDKTLSPSLCDELSQTSYQKELRSKSKAISCKPEKIKTHKQKYILY